MKLTSQTLSAISLTAGGGYGPAAGIPGESECESPRVTVYDEASRNLDPA
jgi:hypothetical protein